MKRTVQKIVVNVTRLQAVQRKARQRTNSWSFRREGSVKGTCGHYGRFCVQGEFCVPKVCDCSIAIDRFFPISTLNITQRILSFCICNQFS